MHQHPAHCMSASKICDQVIEKAIEAGATTVMEVTTMHHAGERNATEGASMMRNNLIETQIQRGFGDSILNYKIQ